MNLPNREAVINKPNTEPPATKPNLEPAVTKPDNEPVVTEKCDSMSKKCHINMVTACLGK